MITIRKAMGIGTYGVVRPAPVPRGRKVLCGYLGCGARATRTAWDRLFNVIDACPDPNHGRSMTS